MIFVLTLGAALLLVFWIYEIIRGIRALRHLIRLGPQSLSPLPSSPPPVSVLIPARNEKEVVGECVRSILAQDYPNFEVVAVDDDSTDNTGKILDEIAKEARGELCVLHTKGELPSGWVGKTYVLSLAAAQARGDWLLMTDADVIHEKNALSSAMGFALKNQIDLLSLLPSAVCVGFWERLIMPIFGILLGIAFPLGEVNNPRRRKALAAGGFILISKAAFDAVDGYSPVADHIVDDVLLAKRVKDKGFRIRLVSGEDLVHTRMYRSFADLWEGIEKSAGAAIDFRISMLLGSLIFFLGTIFLPLGGLVCTGLWFAGLLPNEWQIFTILGLVHGLFLFSVHVAANVRTGVPPIRYALLAPMGYLLYAVVQVSSLVRGRFGGGITWKGRRYYGFSKPLPKSKIGL